MNNLFLTKYVALSYLLGLVLNISVNYTTTVQ